MKTHHPQDPETGERQSDYNDASSDINSAAQDMRMMQTRLADLLDQVSVASAPASVATSDEAIQSSETGHVEQNNDSLQDSAQTGDEQSDFASPLRDILPSDSTLFNSPFADAPPTSSTLASLSERVDESYATSEPASPDEISDERSTLHESDDIDGSSIQNGKSNGVSTATFATKGSQSVFDSDSLMPTVQAEEADDTSNHSTTASIGSFASINSRANSSNGRSADDGASLPSVGNEKDEFASLTKSYSDKGKRGDMPNESRDSGSEANLDETAAMAENANSAITIKGRTDGIAIEVGAGSWRMLMVQLRQRLQQSSGFFRGGSVSLDVGERSLTDEELATAKEILNEHGLNLTLVRSTSEETSQSSSSLGVAVTLDKVEASAEQSALTNHDSLEHFVYRGNLRSGQVLRRAETILILGDVNPGAHVESEGDILVWGRLRGIAHAGTAGDSNAIVSAMLMEPTQLRICDSIAIMPSSDERRSLFGVKKRNPDLAPRPEVAYIAQDTIVVEPWDESKPGGIMAFRRS